MLVLSAVAASAASLPNPRLGAWAAQDGAGGFTLKKKKGKVVLTNYHLTTEEGGCSEKPETATVLGKYPLRVFTRGGASTWGVGKNVGGEAEPMAGKIKAGGKVYAGKFNMIWDFEDVTKEVLSGSMSFGACTIYMSYASPK